MIVTSCNKPVKLTWMSGCDQDNLVQVTDGLGLDISFEQSTRLQMTPGCCKQTLILLDLITVYL